MDQAGFKSLLKKLKTRIGSGGTAKDGVIELQGDQVDLSLDLLTKEGYRPKRELPATPLQSEDTDLLIYVGLIIQIK